MVDLDALARHLIDGHAAEVAALTRQALDEGRAPADILQHGLIAGMRVVGERFRDNVIFVPEVLVAARAMKAALAHLEPVLAACGIQPAGTVVIGTVKGDIHDIGKNLVAMMLEGAGFEVINLGINVDAEKFIAAIKEHQPDILGMSALLTTTMPYMKVVVDTLGEEGMRDDIYVMVGGAPVTENFAREVGADAYGRDAAVSVEIAKSYMIRRRQKLAQPA